MTSVAHRVCSVALAAACAAAMLTVTTARGAAAAPACDADDGGLTLPQGFCALVVAEDLGAARHMTVAPNGDLYVSLMDGRGQTPGVVALRNDSLDVATTTSVERDKMTKGALPQDGYNVTFQPFAGGKPSGKGEIFADGFAGKGPIMRQNDAVARADGVAQAPDGSLYIAENVKGRIWRVIYTGK